MIGSFWNLCRACPSMPVDKLHSEYRSTYRWHEYTGPRQEIIRRPPQSNAAAPAANKANDVHNTTRVQEEETHDELPKLEPALPRRKKHPDLAYRHHEFLVGDGDGNAAFDRADYNSNRARSEERGFQHWRNSRRSKSEGPAPLPDGDDFGRRRESDPDLENTGRDGGLLRKAISKISTEYRLQFAWPQGHKSRRDEVDSTPRKSQSMGALKPAANAMIHKKRVNRDASELEPLVNNRIDENKTEYKKNFRPFSQYEYSEGRFTHKCAPNNEIEESHVKLLEGDNAAKESWYREVVELRKKAGEYKHRGWGSELAPERLTDIYNKQVELWDQVSRRSSLSALSLASTTHRSYTKEEKEEENQKKSSPTKSYRNEDHSSKLMKDFIRHHLGRTTGGSELDGLILSPTREKLEPTIPRKDDNSRSSQRNSPKKDSPQKKNSQKTKSGLRTVRSHSVGPPDRNLEKRSPKRQPRSATVKEKKAAPRRPRPSSLNTSSVSSRSKSSTVPYKKEDDRFTIAKSNKSQFALDNRVQKNNINELRKKNARAIPSKDEEIPADKPREDIDLEPVVKSPPEPTRVKSPEQILMRSPDPVNWTVPLDTGKTFTVTQNIREDYAGRPHSEIKAWTPPDVPPPVAQSAPPELNQPVKEQAVDVEISADETSKLQSLAEEDHSPLKSTCPYLNPSSEIEQVVSTSSSVGRSVVAGVLESALSRFDRFWGSSQKDDSV